MELFRNCFFGEQTKYKRCAEDIKKYLLNNPTFLTRFVADEVPSSKLEALLELKRQLEGVSPGVDRFLLTTGVSSDKFEMCTSYTSRERRASSVSGGEEDVPSAVLLFIRQQNREKFVVLNGKRLEVKCVRSKSISAELRYMLDYNNHKPGFIDSTTMTSPAMPETIEPIPVHGQSIDKTPPTPGRPDHPDQHFDNKSNDLHGNNNLVNAMSNSLPKVGDVATENSKMLTRQHSNGFYAGGPRQAASMNGRSDSSSGHHVVTNGHSRHGSLNGHLNELRQTESAKGALRKPRRVLPVPRRELLHERSGRQQRPGEAVRIITGSSYSDGRLGVANRPGPRSDDGPAAPRSAPSVAGHLGAESRNFVNGNDGPSPLGSAALQGTSVTPPDVARQAFPKVVDWLSRSSAYLSSDAQGWTSKSDVPAMYHPGNFSSK